MRAVKAGAPAAELPTEHYFSGGMYARVMLLRKNVVAVGRVHKKDHLFMVTKGWARVTVDGEVLDMVAPYIITAKAGAKRAVFGVEDSVCMTIHSTNYTTVEEAEFDIVEVDPDTIYGPGNVLKSLEYK